MATPTRMPVLLAGSFVFPLVLTSIDLVLYSGSASACSAVGCGRSGC